MTRNNETIYHVRPAKSNIPGINHSVYSHVRGPMMTKEERSESIRHA